MGLSFEERLRNMTETVGPAENVIRVRKAIENHRWKFATTYAAFCPHEYTLRKQGWSDADFDSLAHHIWLYGMDACYGKQSPKRYWFDHEGGYYYFIFDGDVDKNGHVTMGCGLINRAKIKYFDFWLEEDLLGRIVRCKVRPGAPRLAQEEQEVK